MIAIGALAKTDQVDAKVLAAVTRRSRPNRCAGSSEPNRRLIPGRQRLSFHSTLKDAVKLGLAPPST